VASETCGRKKRIVESVDGQRHGKVGTLNGKTQMEEYW
jgi:hypothetical protein